MKIGTHTFSWVREPQAKSDKVCVPIFMTTTKR